MIIIDYSDKRPIYEQVTDRLQSLIMNGVLEADEKLPSVRALAMELSINPNTIQRAYSELEREGFIYSVKGRGNFVRADEDMTKKQQNKLLEQFRKMIQACKESGIDYEKMLIVLEEIYIKPASDGKMPAQSDKEVQK